MARILITSGPTRQYLDPVRYLTNASSGRMGKSLAEAAIEAGHDVVIVSGPVEVKYPATAEVVDVVSTEEMLAECQRLFQQCDGVIGVAAPCDYRPVRVEPQKNRQDRSAATIEFDRNGRRNRHARRCKTNKSMGCRLRARNDRPALAGARQARKKALRPDRTQWSRSHERAYQPCRSHRPARRRARNNRGLERRSGPSNFQSHCFATVVELTGSHVLSAGLHRFTVRSLFAVQNRQRRAFIRHRFNPHENAFERWCA